MNLIYFKGKVCSILTNPIQRKLKDQTEEMQYFVGVIEEISKDGVFMTQISTGLKSYFNMNNIIGIFEEEVLDPTTPDDNEIIKEINNFTNENINIDSISDLLNVVKNN